MKFIVIWTIFQLFQQIFANFCGIESEKNGRVTFMNGGNQIPRKTFGWVVTVFEWSNPDDSLCGGVLIGSQTVLTAAHCLFHRAQNGAVILRDPPSLIVRYFSNDEIREVAVQDFRIHSGWNSMNWDDWNFDLAILILEDIIEDTIPICLPHWDLQERINHGETCIVAGFLEDGEGMAYTPIPLASSEVCREQWGGERLIDHDSMFCGGITSSIASETQGPCRGDSGGPVMCLRDGVWVVMGVTSWGSLICLRKPTIFSDVSKLVSWIYLVLQDEGMLIPEREGYLNFSPNTSRKDGIKEKENSSKSEGFFFTNKFRSKLKFELFYGCNIKNYAILLRSQIVPNRKVAERPNISPYDCLRICCNDKSCNFILYHILNEMCEFYTSACLNGTQNVSFVKGEVLFAGQKC